jgi:hypothetical protein
MGFQSSWSLRVCRPYGAAARKNNVRRTISLPEAKPQSSATFGVEAGEIILLSIAPGVSVIGSGPAISLLPMPGAPLLCGRRASCAKCPRV